MSRAVHATLSLECRRVERLGLFELSLLVIDLTQRAQRGELVGMFVAEDTTLGIDDTNEKRLGLRVFSELAVQDCLIVDDGRRLRDVRRREFVFAL